MRKQLLFTLKLFVLALTSLQFNSVYAISTASLEDWIFNIDGNIHQDAFNEPLPTTGALVDGFGTLSLDVTSAGSHNIIGYFDFEIFEATNTFFNESGAATGVPGIGQTWEIDEPGFSYGDIVDNVFAGTLDESVGVTPGNEDDVAFAIGWNFSLLQGDTATIDFIFSDLLPTADFFLSQTDANSGDTIYFESVLNIQTAGGPAGPVVTVPEPPAIYLLLIGLVFLFLKNTYQTMRRPAKKMALESQLFV